MHLTFRTSPDVPQEFKGYVFKIMGGQDKQGFPMRQGVMTNLRVKLLMSPGDPCMLGYGRRKGERRRKAVRGCVVSPDLSVLNLVIVKQGALPCQTESQRRAVTVLLLSLEHLGWQAVAYNPLSPPFPPSDGRFPQVSRSCLALPTARCPACVAPSVPPRSGSCST